jgi:hypothetical protein
MRAGCLWTDGGLTPSWTSAFQVCSSFLMNLQRKGGEFSTPGEVGRQPGEGAGWGQAGAGDSPPPSTCRTAGCQ